MKIDCYVINLDRSPDRLAAIRADAAAAGLSLIRVPAVDGKSVPEADRTLLEEAGFRRLHGKRPMAGEFGCYASHLKALHAFLAGEADAALVLEDDARPPEDLAAALGRIASVDDWDLVKLTHHRMPLLRGDRSVGGSHRLGRAVFGPTGSSAAYLVNRVGAAALLNHLVPMRLPYDVAFERGWAFGIRVRHVVPDLVSINPATKKSLTREGQKYAAMKLPLPQRIGTLGFRASELFRRLAYAALRSRS